MGFCYRSITFKELPEKVRTPLLLAIGELDWQSLPLLLLQEASPEQATITKPSRVNGFCTLSEPFLIGVVVKRLSQTLRTLYHEYEHYSVHRLAFNSEQIPIAEPLLESDADDAGIKGLEAFKAKYPKEFEDGEQASIQWLKENQFGAYNDTQINESDFFNELTETIQIMKSINSK
jgi:hypothetical protein